MAKFILIDHSLRSVGGHHYEYADQILREAHRSACEIVLATHRQFRRPASFPQSWRVLPLLPYDVYNRYAIPWGRGVDRAVWSEQWSPSTSFSAEGNPATWFSAVSRNIRSRIRRRRLKRFADACRQLFRIVELARGDIVFVATISVFDMVALTSFLRQAPQTAAATWHLQFHHDVLEGREGDYKRQHATLQAVRRAIRQRLDSIPYHRLVFHATTAQLAGEYNRLEIGEFAELPYPVNPKFYAPRRFADASDSATLAEASNSECLDDGEASPGAVSAANREPVPSRRLTITCAGGMRREKGSHAIAAVIDQLWQPYFETGRVRLRVQTNWRRFHLLSRGHRRRSGIRNDQPLERIPHPLDLDAYVELIHTSDIGLLLYDSWSYYTRASGILVEMLTAGVPVIVPAGCWLAKQVAEPIYRYVDGIYRENPPMRRLGVNDAAWSRPVGNPKVCFGGTHAELRAELNVPREAAYLLVRFRHTAAPDTGRYVQIRFVQRHSQGARLDESLYVLDPRGTSEQPLGAILPLIGDAARVQLTFSDAFNCGIIEVTALEFVFLSAHDGEVSTPTGAVGLIASEPSQIPRLLAEIVDHYGHYRRTAELFSHEWIKRHSPRTTFATLVAREAEALRREKTHQAA